ncbi:MAG: NAD(P)H-dependent glycerol-3-phosphate dehydrogenase [Rothia sp. (in: high G+C Gram-positive bacteria)]|uniref:NAD(P)H-dependent glycerol-3-phosphate dehydrogenase n=1 Tax=Rothia sp. (in: high G+C Gram-positive bacteria) TaxID=1885016 RepID=UPI0026E0FEB3|nr:NAD(P)H-dependent glycerol-3-phosphate dehydrogenase [Rothia sp. (in: high G+C Gram-positive bacteria)]MDO5750961.1 NAD(P)H-dependent glycerol-3-phosphate dehydrogenase [Rothia sp. (in: high G+C Gram-positive bacteria)]
MAAIEYTLPERIDKIAVLGAGSWGTAFAKIAADAALEANRDTSVVLVGRDAQAMAQAEQTRTNDRYFPGIALPANVEFTADAPVGLRDAQIVVLALPSQVLREQLLTYGRFISQDAILVSLAKGLEVGTGLRMSQVITEAMEESMALAGADIRRIGHIPHRVTVLSGPNLATEIMGEEPTASVVAARTLPVAEMVAAHCAASYFRPYTSTDVTGVEIGGLVKNVIALCVGMCEGMNYGDNSKASVMTRGLAETTRLALALGGIPSTLSGLAGMGDLIATCSSPLSRNHTAGRLLASGISPSQLHEHMSQTAEAIKSAPVLAQLARRHGIEMPIVEAVVAVLTERISVEQLAPLLLGRSLKREGH